MRLKVSLSSHSINDAIKQLERAKKQFVEMKTEFYHDCCNWFIQRANHYLDLADIGIVPKSQIQSSWEYTIVGDKITITNNADKAVFVEFGVGIEGQGDPHPNANNTNYEYDVDSDFKLIDRSWLFRTTEEELDLPRDKVDVLYNKDSKMSVQTFGSQGVMYAYNALMDLNIEKRKIWNSIKKKYWG